MHEGHDAMDDDTPRVTERAPVEPSDVLLSVVPAPSTDGEREYESSFEPSSATWRAELLRWLATLNPGRTQTEYSKAVRYFFETPGVPSELDELTFDLLLAYRGALAVRATAHTRSESGSAHRGGTRPALEGATRPQRIGAADRERAETSQAKAQNESNQGLLSPATVNLRLTALRQFLVHCSLLGSLPQLSPDRIRAALRRMSIERRRPYQVLAEQEWAGFLEAARLPATLTDAETSATGDGAAAPSSAEEGGPAGGTDDRTAAGPWGTPRALRQTVDKTTGDDAGGATGRAPVTLPRSHAGLTGRYTAQRDFALVSLALATGLRAIELAELDVGDLVREWQNGTEEWWLVLPDAKTKGQHGGRTLPLAATLIETLLTYIVSTGRRWEREADRSTPLFLAGRRQRIVEPISHGAAHRGGLSPQQIRAIVDRVETQWLAQRQANASSGASPAGETRKISPHALRHSTAIALLSGDDASGRPPASVEHVRGWLGHFDIRTTQGYLAHLDARRHRRPFTLSMGQPPSTPPPDDSAEQ